MNMFALTQEVINDQQTIDPNLSGIYRFEEVLNK